MSSHTRGELREAAQVLARAALKAGVRPSATMPVAAAQASASAGSADGEAPRLVVYDGARAA
ncbi:MAG: hypothetical protein QOE86_745, partial [Solirubrobacteraceae bacterium]|nr:hypothetical protein [Solirubrobacteraceae bacterium]